VSEVPCWEDGDGRGDSWDLFSGPEPFVTRLIGLTQPDWQ